MNKSEFILVTFSYVILIFGIVCGIGCFREGNFIGLISFFFSPLAWAFLNVLVDISQNIRKIAEK